MYLKRNKTIYIVAGITDMRKQINGLSAIAQNKKSEAVFSGAYFVFLGKTLNILVRRKRLSDTEEIANPVQGNQSSSLWATIEEPPEWGGLSHFKQADL